MRACLRCLCLCVVATLASSLPHWRECGACVRCGFGPDRPGLVATLPFCDACGGCTHSLEPHNRSVVIDGYTFVMHPGSTKAQLFVATDASGVRHFLKLTPSRPGGAGAPGLRPSYQHSAGSRHVAKARAFEALAVSCGVAHVLALDTLTPVRVVLPGGVKFEAPSMVLSQLAKGASAEMINIKKPAFFDTLLGRTRSADWVSIALFDLLTVQGDRHNEQLFIDEAGTLTAIDTTHQMLSGDGLDSVLWPTTYYYRRNAIGFDTIKERSVKPKTHHLNQLFFDYRCHVGPGGAEPVPPAFAACLAETVASAPEELALRLFGDAMWLPLAQLLHAQAGRMARDGVLATLAATRHSNSTGMVPTQFGFPLVRECCDPDACLAQQSLFLKW